MLVKKPQLSDTLDKYRSKLLSRSLVRDQDHWYGVTSGPLLGNYFSVRLLREIREGKTLGNVQNQRLMDYLTGKTTISLKDSTSRKHPPAEISP